MSQTTVTTIGPADHGRRMSLEEFEHAEGQEGHLYELSRGVIIVVDVPRPKHFLLVDAIRKQLSTYRERYLDTSRPTPPGLVQRISRNGLER
jgi:hypothetical protein